MAAKPAPFREQFHPESRFGGFSRVDLMMEFYVRVAALLKPSDRVLDYGAGRGGVIDEDTVPYRKSLKILRGRCAQLDGCDIDEAVLANPYLDAARVFDPEGPLPYADESFDLIYSNWVFEHVEDARQVSRELLRVLKPGGHICAVTPNKWGYIALASRLTGNARHVRLLRHIQPDREEFDIFPTCYQLNTPRDIKRHFGDQADIHVYAVSGEPAYHFNNVWMYRLFRLVHALTPGPLNAILLVFIRKR